MAGFEGADHHNLDGAALDMVGITGHAERLDADYRDLAERGVRTVRESIGWRLCEPRGGGRFDFDRARRMAQAAQRQGVQLLWTLMHYGVPPDVSLLDGSDACFCERFAAFGAAAADALSPWIDTAEAPVFTPVNEISFLAWAACETNLIHPHVGDRADPRHVPLPDGYALKRRLVRASLAAMAAIRNRLPRARFLHIDPLVHVVPPAGAGPDLTAEAARFRDFQWQSWDMLSGRIEPALGGSLEALDLVGINHYWTAQWEFATGASLRWQPGPDGPAGDARRMSLSALLQEIWQRYRRPLVIAETGHCDGARARWLAWVAAEADAARAAGVDLRGVCLYPIIGRPDWNAPTDWHRCGLWDAEPAGSTRSARQPIGEPGRHLVVDLDQALARYVAASARHPEPTPSPAPAPAAAFRGAGTSRAPSTIETPSLAVTLP